MEKRKRRWSMSQSIYKWFHFKKPYQNVQKTYQTASSDVKRCMCIVQSFTFMPFLFMEGQFSFVCLIAEILPKDIFFGGVTPNSMYYSGEGSPKIVPIRTRGEGGKKRFLPVRTYLDVSLVLISRHDEWQWAIILRSHGYLESSDTQADSDKMKLLKRYITLIFYVTVIMVMVMFMVMLVQCSWICWIVVLLGKQAPLLVFKVLEGSIRTKIPQ